MSNLRERRRNVRRSVAITAIATLALAACGGGPSPTPPASSAPSASAATPAGSGAAATAATDVTATSVGTVDGTSAMIAVQEHADGSALVYVCDGATVWDYLQGTMTGASLDADDAVDGTQLSASRDGADWKGTVRLPDGAHTFTAQPATGNAGLFSRASRPADGLVRIGGWIRLADGTVKGKEVVATTSGAAGDTSAGGQDAGGTVEVPPDAEPTSLGGLVKCGIAGARVKIARNHLDRDPNFGNIANLVHAQQNAQSVCATAAN